MLPWKRQNTGLKKTFFTGLPFWIDLVVYKEASWKIWHFCQPRNDFSKKWPGILLLGTSTIWDILKQYRGIIKDSVKILGVTMSTNKKVIEDNYNPVLWKMKDTIKTWSRRTISLTGKIGIIKMLVLSKLIYCMTVLPSGM